MRKLLPARQPSPPSGVRRRLCALHPLSFPAEIKVSAFVNKLSSPQKASAAFSAVEDFLLRKVTSAPAASAGCLSGFLWKLFINLKSSHTLYPQGALLLQPFLN